jgi:hypothetical protein
MQAKVPEIVSKVVWRDLKEEMETGEDVSTELFGIDMNSVTAMLVAEVQQLRADLDALRGVK